MLCTTDYLKHCEKMPRTKRQQGHSLAITAHAHGLHCVQRQPRCDPGHVMRGIAPG